MARRNQGGRSGAQGLRGPVAVLALYALVLQGLLGGIAALPLAAKAAMLCAPAAPVETPDGRGAPHQHAGCCSLAAPSPAGPLPAPPDAARLLAACPVDWDRAAAPAVPPSPVTRARARAPPDA
ncbi:hypothetical protein MMB17_21425 [Methylobacterium organophilum]|uniref:hypothetical protein n=1 Tax=Methylobacterium organophilum TaxID=410 RepID=UPI001F136BC7|nr:hypothetical protein [Methylobacterium organophilum]UMY17174.1 hypothetical protein MMB17_21425 [Methylobacterium organophilum]